MQVFHRPGSFKQKNKSHKHGRHKSKSEIKKASKGKIHILSIKPSIKMKKKQDFKKHQRKNMRKQLRMKKNHDHFIKKKSLGFTNNPPFIVSLVSLSKCITTKNFFIDYLEKHSEENIKYVNDGNYLHVLFTFIFPDCDDIFSILNCIKVSNMVLFLHFDSNCDMLDDVMPVIFAHGLPPAIHVLIHSGPVSLKEENEIKKTIQITMQRYFSKIKFFKLSAKNDLNLLLQCLSNQKCVDYQYQRFHMITEKDSVGTLCFTGYVRGFPLIPESFIYVHNIGVFKIDEIREENDTFLFENSKNRGCKNQLITQNYNINYINEDKMNSECSMAFEELPMEINTIENNYENSSDIKMNDNEMDADEKSNSSIYSNSESSIEFSTDDEGTHNLADELKELNELKDSKAEELFSDEVEASPEIPARLKFKKYCALKNFNDSAWNIKENLPSDYNKIFQFTNMKTLKKSILNNTPNSISVGKYVTICIYNISKHIYENIRSQNLIIIFGMLKHEEKISVCNFVLKRVLGNSYPIRNRTRLIFHVGYRYFSVCPIFSEHSNAKKHKLLHDFNSDSIIVATTYAPITFPPVNVTVFQEQDGRYIFIASGKLSINPERIILKRRILLGYPYKIHRRSAVIRYMFFNREDVLWFRSVELRTKLGRRGHIKEPLGKENKIENLTLVSGTHGYMKCVFDKQLNSNDVVLLPLYKRVFPKWSFEDDAIYFNCP